MPQINLLSPQFGKKLKKTKAFEVPKVPVDKVVSLTPSLITSLVTIVLCLLLVMFVLIRKSSNELSDLEKKEKSQAIDPQELVKLNEKKQNLTKKIELLEQFSSRDFFWWMKLQQIAQDIPDGIWLNTISMSKKIVSKDDKAGKSEYEERTILIKGSAVAYKIQDAVSKIGEFINILKDNQDFSQDFKDIKLSTVTKASVGKTDIMNFEFACILQ